jgi:hypothetical protein
MKFQYIFPLLILAAVSFIFPIAAIADPPVNAVKFVILNPDDSTAGTPVTITIEAQDSEDQVDESYQNDVTLVTDGSATGAGLVDVVNGVGTIEINDDVAETITLSLSDTEATGLDASSTEEVEFEAAEADGAVKFVILEPSGGTAGTPVTITIEAQDSEDQVDESYQNDVTLVTDGSATGAGLVDIVNGVGTIEINDEVAETVILSLADTESTGLDVSSTQEVEFEAVEEVDANWDQQKFWFRDDDGDEISATGYGSENVGINTNIINIVQGALFRLRFDIKLTNTDGAISSRLEFKEGTDCTTGSWETITPTSATVNLEVSPNFDDGASTTQQLVAGPNFVAGRILESTNPASSLDLPKNKNTEYEWSLGITPDTPFSTTYSFRVTNNGIALDNYDQCPSLTVQASPPSPPPSGGGGGGGGGVRPTTVTFSGKAFPGAKILVVDKDIRLEKIVSQNMVANEEGKFSLSFVGILKSQHSFGLLVKDKENRVTPIKFFNINTFANNLTVKDILVPPTVGFTQGVVTRGRNAVIVGYASPENDVKIEIGDIKKEIKAAKDGSYKAEVNTGMLEFGQYRVRVKQADPREKKESAFSIMKTLVVSRLISPKTDLSGDGRVDIKDWSIFLSNWESEDDNQKKIIDLNDDGKTDISDFSIFIRTIKK